MARQAKRGSYLDISGDSLQGFQTITASTSLTIASPKQGYVSSPAAAVTVTLPTTDVKAGFVYKIDVVGATETNFVRLNSSGGNEVDRIGGEGFIQVMALQDSPTTAAHWRIVNMYEKSTTAPVGSVTFGNSSPTTLQSSWFILSRSNKNVTLSIGQVYTTISPGSVTSVSVAACIPVRFRHSQARFIPVIAGISNGIGAVSSQNSSNGLVATGGALEAYGFNQQAALWEMQGSWTI
jgi:hypothetical protein